jgi:hypothetical protein
VGNRHDRMSGEALRREAEERFPDQDFPADPFAR